MHPHPKLQPWRQHTPGVPNTGNGPRPTEFRTPPGMKKKGKKKSEEKSEKKIRKKNPVRKKTVWCGGGGVVTVDGRKEGEGNIL